MRKVAIIILVFFFNFASLNSEIVNKIEILGNKRVSKETVKIYGEIDINKDYSEKKINNIINNLYSTNFFEDVTINLSNGILTVNLIEYPVINQLIFLGETNNKYLEEIKKIIGLKEKNSFIKNNIPKDVETIKKLYSSLGYNFIKVDSKVKKIDEGSVDLIFELDRGEITKISKISFIGDKKIREKRLRDVIASEEDKFWKVISKNTRYNENLINLDLRLLENYYKSIGYYDVKISSNSAEILKSGDIELIYTIDAGQRYIIKKITTTIDPVFNKDIFFPLNKEFQKHLGNYYSPFKIKKLLEEIDNIIDENNLQFVEHNVEEIVENDSIVINFNINEGEKILVERINILGNNVTNESVIRSELLLDEGDPFTNLNLDKSVSKVKARNIFGSVTSSIKDGSDKNLKIIDINVEERATGEISAGAGFGTSGGSFAINVSENNWLGEGKKVGFDAEVTSESIRGSLRYTNPNYNLLGNSLSYFLSSTSNDKPDQGYENSLITTGASTSFEQYKDLFATLGIAASYDDLKTLDTASSSLKKQSGNFSEISGSYGFTLDKRNRKFMPTDGSIISFDQSLPIYADKKFIANAFSLSSYKSLSENVVGAGKLYISTVTGIGDDDVRISKRKSLSSKRLRGFQRGKVGPVDGTDHIGGNYATAINFEANLPNLLPEATKTDVGLFIDIANVWGVDYDSTINESNKIRSSTGIATSWMSPVGPMTFVLSTNLAKASTDTTESFNFNLGTTF